jgi:hypothetical protein
LHIDEHVLVFFLRSVHIEPIQVLLLLIQLGHALLRLQVLVEGHQLVPHLLDHLDLRKQHLVQVSHIFFNIWARLVNFIEKNHLLFDEVDHFIDVLTVPVDELFLFLEDLLNQLLVLIAQLVCVISILSF